MIPSISDMNTIPSHATVKAKKMSRLRRAFSYHYTRHGDGDGGSGASGSVGEEGWAPRRQLSVNVCVCVCVMSGLAVVLLSRLILAVASLDLISLLSSTSRSSLRVSLSRHLLTSLDISPLHQPTTAPAPHLYTSTDCCRVGLLDST